MNKIIRVGVLEDDPNMQAYLKAVLGVAAAKGRRTPSNSPTYKGYAEGRNASQWTRHHTYDRGFER